MTNLSAVKYLTRNGSGDGLGHDDVSTDNGAAADADVFSDQRNAAAAQFVLRNDDRRRFVGADNCVCVDDGILREHHTVNNSAFSDVCAGEEDRIPDDRSRFNGDAGKEDRIFNTPVNGASFRHAAVFDNRARCQVLRREVQMAAVNFPFFVIQIQRRRITEQIHVGIIQALDGSDVFPVAAERVGVDGAAVPQHGRDDVFPEIVGACRICFVCFQIGAQSAS